MSLLMQSCKRDGKKARIDGLNRRVTARGRWMDGGDCHGRVTVWFEIGDGDISDSIMVLFIRLKTRAFTGYIRIW